MPTYTYACAAGCTTTSQVWTIAEMEAYDFAPALHCEVCLGDLVHQLSRHRRHISFHEGFYEHISDTGAHVSNMSDLRRIAKENGNYSTYAEDHGGLFRAKEGRWV